MNERLLELYKQARVPDTFIDPSNNMPCETTSFSAEKFAELIIKECVDLMEGERKMYADPGTYESREYYERMAAKEDAFGDAASMIKYHFGVK